MKRIDRAMYAIFLLVLLADVARAHASVSVGSDASLILSAASQIQVNQIQVNRGEEAIRALRRVDKLTQNARFERFVSKFSEWSSRLVQAENSMLLGAVAVDLEARSTACSVVQEKLTTPSLAIFTHTSSPAP